jgi:hypothetical protein
MAAVDLGFRLIEKTRRKRDDNPPPPHVDVANELADERDDRTPRADAHDVLCREVLDGDDVSERATALVDEGAPDEVVVEVFAGLEMHVVAIDRERRADETLRGGGIVDALEGEERSSLMTPQRANPQLATRPVGERRANGEPDDECILADPRRGELHLAG